MIQGTDATTAALSREVDPYGDSYTLDTDRATIEGALAEVAAKRAHPFDGGAPFAAGENRTNRAHAQAAMPSTLQFHLAKSPPGQWTMCAVACARDCLLFFSKALLLIRCLFVR